MATSQDPPFEPLPDSATWFESGPEMIAMDRSLATLIVRLGMASNALTSQQKAGVDAATGSQAERYRGLIASMVTSAALTNEAIRLASKNLRTLRGLAEAVDMRQELLESVGRLCAGKHSASATLKRARNQIAFHWDADIVDSALSSFTRNEKLVWLEFAKDGQPVHRLATDVVVHALLPHLSNVPDEATTKRLVQESLADIGDAMGQITEFFAGCIYGYFMRAGGSIVRRTR